MHEVKLPVKLWFQRLKLKLLKLISAKVNPVQ